MTKAELDAIIDARIASRRSEPMALTIGAVKSRTVRFGAVIGFGLASAPEIAALWSQHIAPQLPPQASAHIMAIIGFLVGARQLYIRMTTTESLEAKGGMPTRSG